MIFRVYCCVTLKYEGAFRAILERLTPAHNSPNKFEIVTGMQKIEEKK